MQELKHQEPLEFVQNIFEETGKSQRDAENLANALTRLTGDLYTETERFIFELLQNADDLPNTEGKVDVKFVVLKEHFLILHNGQPFDYENVDAISSISKSTKSNNPEQTGYKGIGFKSVFADSECVYINSGSFSFKFDKHDKTHTNIDKTPWQIKPIWVEQKNYPQEIQQYQDFFSSPVATAIKVGREKIEEYKQKLHRLFHDPRLILFLRYVKNIDVIGLTNNFNVDIQITKNKQSEKYQIIKNRETTYWLVKDFEFDVSQEVREKMEGDKKVPDKLKKVERSKLSFAAQIKNDKLEAVDKDNSVLFTYLPTNVKEYGFPFLVNADFLTTANRQEIHHDNVWNIFIFEQIGYHIFSWIAQLAQNQTYKNQITSLVPSKYTSLLSETQDAFNQGFDLAIKEIAFLPCEDNDSKLLMVHQAIIDEIEIIKILPAEEIRQFFDVQRHFISNSLTNKRNLKQFKIKAFDTTALCNFFEDSQEYENLIQNNPFLNFTVIEHLGSKNVSNEDLVSIPFILDEEENFISPDNLYFQIERSEKELLNFSSFHFIHPDIDQSIQKDKKLLSWVKENLKIKAFSAVKIIKERINQRKYSPDDNKQNLDSCLNYVRFIFKHHTKLSLEYRQKLRDLQLIYQKEESEDFVYTSAESCYLSNFYKPQNPVEEIASLIGTDYFKLVISDYCENTDDINAWKEFFIAIGVADSNGLEIVHNKIIPMIEDNEIDDSNTINITRFIFDVWKTFTLSSEDSEVLKKLRLATNNGLQIASNCNLSDFYTNDEIELESVPLLDIDLPNVITKEYYRSGDTLADWRRFFTNVLGVADSQGIELIQKRIQQLADSPNLVTVHNAVEICQQIFKYYDSLTRDDLNKLHKLNLLLVNGKLAAAGECYFSNHYNPKLNLESFYDNTDFDKFVSPLYCNSDTPDKEKWKEFFKYIGVEDELRFTIYNECTLSSRNEIIKKYFIKVGLNLYKPTYKFQNVIVFLHREYLSNFDFAKRFWEYVNYNWNDLNLDRNSIVLINDTPKQVYSLFKFLINNHAFIPCNDGNSHSSSEGIYSSNLKKIIDDTFLVASCNLKEKVEQFIGLKQQLDLQDCLELLDDVAEKYHHHKSKEEIRLNLIYEQLLKCIRQGLDDDDREIIADWVETGKLLACDEQFYKASQLYYLDIAIGLPPKRNANLIKFPDSNLNGFEFEEILTALGIRKLSWDDIQRDLPTDTFDDILPNLIKERAIFIGIFLNGSRHLKSENRIKSQVDNIQFYNPGKIIITCNNINYKESIPNYYDEEYNSIYYVRKWNSIKNINLGDYLIDALALDKGKISTQVLLRLLDDDIEDVKDYLLDSGCNIEGIPDVLLPKDDQDDVEKSIEETESIQNNTRNIVSSPDGTGSNIKYWGEWGEKQAKIFYERLGYNAQKQDDFLAVGYDFICTGYEGKTLYSEVKTISSNEPMIRLKQSQWKSMCSKDKKDNYELVIVVHEGNSLIEIIRVSSAWATLKNILSQLAQQYITETEYEKQVEVLLGFQQNSEGKANEIIFNWQRLLKSVEHSHINIYPQGIVNSGG
ncbi:sacsin N-terminal ATP-binding-like domain-containing protein [Rivularia sp. UHCC 0363]|uniref:sacsin N-terminal ATP-binding-like domain-containing protein n=1 Tax=Rivularia sp. UHCC 0363 TaxID=3110244 RepID=UPI002B205EFC|nr:DUF3883 domain-containing protein [Rivularia sp. UHCC 0363]MEA5597393.1 DUF3883 domain-containing protein [Rivularia sp. UHCC 0363]